MVVDKAVGCATRSVDGRPQPSAQDCVGWPCDAGADGLEQVQERPADTAYTFDANVGNNVVVLPLWCE